MTLYSFTNQFRIDRHKLKVGSIISGNKLELDTIDSSFQELCNLGICNFVDAHINFNAGMEPYLVAVSNARVSNESRNSKDLYQIDYLMKVFTTEGVTHVLNLLSDLVPGSGFFLTAAVALDRISVVKTILEILPILTEECLFIIHIPAKKGFTQMVEYLYPLYPDPIQALKSSFECGAQKMCEFITEILIRMELTNTESLISFLNNAIMRGYYSVIERLIIAGADVKEVDKYSIITLIEKSPPTLSIKILRFLKDHGRVIGDLKYIIYSKLIKDISIEDFDYFIIQESALTAGFLQLIMKEIGTHNRLDILEYLDKSGYDLQYSHGSLLKGLIDGSHIESSKYIMETYDVESSVISGLFSAVIQKKSLEMIKLFVESGADVNRHRGFVFLDSPLQEAIKTLEPKNVAYLIESGAEIGPKNIEDGLLDVCIRYYSYKPNAMIEILKILSKEGLDVNEIRKMGLLKKQGMEDHLVREGLLEVKID